MRGLYISTSNRRSRDDLGATATEYGLLVLFIALAIVFSVTAFGTELSQTFTALADAVGLLPTS